MKLVDILARELKVWPHSGDAVGQASDNTLHLNERADHRGHLFGWTEEKFTQAEDCNTAWVTRAEWQAAVEALKAEKAAELKWPNGATHYVPPQEKNENGVFYLVVNDDTVYSWALLKSGVDNGGRVYGESKRHQLPDAIPRPTERAVEWDGVGFPPVGKSVCEYLGARQFDLWTVVDVIAVWGEGNNTTVFVDYGDGWRAEKDPCRFRPVRTQEQIAAEEREKAIEEIRKDTDYILDEICASAVLAAGYRKQVTK